jgi:hypothetical protein
LLAAGDVLLRERRPGGASVLGAYEGVMELCVFFFFVFFGAGKRTRNAVKMEQAADAAKPARPVVVVRARTSTRELVRTWPKKRK